MLSLRHSGLPGRLRKKLCMKFIQRSHARSLARSTSAMLIVYMKQTIKCLDGTRYARIALLPSAALQLFKKFFASDSRGAAAARREATARCSDAVSVSDMVRQDALDPLAKGGVRGTQERYSGACGTAERAVQRCVCALNSSLVKAACRACHARFSQTSNHSKRMKLSGSCELVWREPCITSMITQTAPIPSMQLQKAFIACRCRQTSKPRSEQRRRLCCAA